MRKTIKKLAQAMVIVLTTEEMQLHGLQRGDLVEVQVEKINGELNGPNQA